MTPPADLPHVPGYELLEELGRGASSRVFSAREPEGQRVVAIKVLGATDSSGLERFRREVAALTRLRHPHIVAVHGSGTTSAGEPYYVMERVVGRHLRQALGELSLRDVAQVLATLAHALDHAHLHGLVHRDVKPSNVVLDAEGAPHLIDFGLAALGDETDLTSLGKLVGAPACVPPEVARGDVLRADARGDVYALGVILYEALCGQVPFAEITSLVAYLGAVGSRRPQAPSELAQAALPPGLERICRRAMDPDPARRHPSASALAHELEAWLAGDLPAAEGGTDVALEAARALITPDVVRLIRDLARPAQEAQAVPLQLVLQRLLEADLELGGVLDLALDFVLTATGAREGFVLVADDQGRLVLERGRGIDSNSIPPELCTSVLAEVSRTRQPTISGDAASDARFAHRESVVSTGLRSVACLPILDPVSRELLGAIYLQDRATAGRFGPHTEALLSDLGRLTAGPIRRARRFEAERRAHSVAQSALRERGLQAPSSPRLVGKSEALSVLLRQAERAAATGAPVLVHGESGSGKELVARLVHASSARREGPFVAENCGALSESLLEAELFGVVRGAYTGADQDRPGLFQRADGGTLFLDEVGELTPACQTKLLRTLQEGEVRAVGGTELVRVDVRLVTATHRDLSAMVEAGEFRQDLLYRLKVIPLEVPPLRARKEDIPLLLEHFLDEVSAERGIPRPQLSPALLQRLGAHDWPGNVRELRNVLLRVLALGEESWAPERSASVQGAIRLDLAAWGEALPPLQEARAAFDRELISAVLAQHKGNVTHAAEALCIRRSNLSRLIKKLGIER